jgi:hypothetical protein
MSQITPGTHRRHFIGGVAASAATLILNPWSDARAEIAASGEAPPSDEWLTRIKGKYRQVFDCTSPNDGFGAAFPLNFISSTKEAVKVTEKDIGTVVVFRHMAMPLVLNDAMWEKYKIGEMLNVKDPNTSAPATRNVFRANVPLNPGLTYERLMSDHGVIVVACNLALTVISGMLAPKAGVTPEQAKTEWTENVIPGVALAASGVYAVNRAQGAGCTYCFGG